MQGGIAKSGETAQRPVVCLRSGASLFSNKTTLTLTLSRPTGEGTARPVAGSFPSSWIHRPTEDDSPSPTDGRGPGCTAIELSTASGKHQSSPSPREARTGRGLGRGVSELAQSPSSPRPSPPFVGGEGDVRSSPREPNSIPMGP